MANDHACCFSPPAIQFKFMLTIFFFFYEGGEYCIVINCGSWDIWQVLDDKFVTFKYDQHAATPE